MATQKPSAPRALRPKQAPAAPAKPEKAAAADMVPPPKPAPSKPAVASAPAAEILPPLKKPAPEDPERSAAPVTITKPADPPATPPVAAPAPRPTAAPKPKEPAMTMKDTLDTVAATSTNAAKEGMEKAMAAMSEMNALTKANMEAMMASASAATKGMETLSSRSMAYSKDAMEKSVAAMKAMTAAKSMQELVELQADYVKSSMDAFMGEMNKTVELVTASTKDSLKPLNDRAAAFMTLMQTKR